MRQVPNHYYGWRHILPFFTVIIIDVMSFGIIIPVLAPLIATTTGGLFAHYNSPVIRHLLYGVISSITPLCYIIGGPIIGHLSDRLGRKTGLILCSLGSLLGLACYSLSMLLSSLLLLLIGRVIIGITMGGQAVAQSAMADISQGKQKVGNIGLIAVAMTIGLVSGPLLGGVLSDSHVVSWFNNTTPFYFAMGLAVINLIFVNLLVPKRVSNSHTSNHYPFIAQLKAFTLHSSLRMLFTIFLLFELSWSLYFQSLPLLVVEAFHASNSQVGLISAYVGLVLSIGLIFLVRIAANYCSLSRMINYGLIVGTLALFAAFFCRHPLSQWLIAIPISLSVAICYAALVTLASDHVAKDKQGLLMGTTDSLIAIAFTISGFLAGILTTKLHPQLPQLVAALFDGVAMIMALAWAKSLRQQPSISTLQHETAAMVAVTAQTDS